MATGVAPAFEIVTVADLLERLGGIPAERVRWQPLPGTATEEDVIEIERRENRLCELVDGVLVEKAMGFRESVLASFLIGELYKFVAPRKLGLVAAPDGMMRLAAGLVRMPDVSFISWARLPGGKIPKAPIPRLAPDLAVEVLSPGNTAAEMERKRREYFKAGVSVVWLVDPVARRVTVYTAPDQFRVLAESETLDGGQVLPGFALSLRELFADLDR